MSPGRLGLGLLAALLLSSCGPTETAKSGPRRRPHRAVKRDTEAGAADDAKPRSVPTIVVDRGNGPFSPGGVLKGAVHGLPPPGDGLYVLAWTDPAGTLARREIAGPGTREFEFDLSYPRFVRNSIVLTAAQRRDLQMLPRRLDKVVDPTRPGIAGADTRAWADFEIDMPPAGRKGYLRVLDPGKESLESLADFPAEAVLWNVRRRPEPPELRGRALVIDLALEDVESPRGGDNAPPAEAPLARRLVVVPTSPHGGADLDQQVRARIRGALSSPAARRAAAVSLGTGLPARLKDGTLLRNDEYFRDILCDKYAHGARDAAALGAVARALGQELHSWADVRTPVLRAAELAAASRYTAWADSLEIRERAIAGFLRETAKLARRRLPGVPVGFFGLHRPSAYDGADFDSLGRALEWRGGRFLPGARRLALKCGAAGRTLASRGTAGAGAALRAGLSGSLLQVFGPQERGAARACDALAGGLGRLIETSTPPRPSTEGAGFPGAQVALVYSRASVRASFLMDVRAGARPPASPAPAGPLAPQEIRAPASNEIPFGAAFAASWDRIWEGWCAILSDLGVPFVPLTEEEVAAGALVSGRFRAAVLVRMLSVSEDAAYSLREFADSGGILIADAGTGMFGRALVRVRGSGAQELFGIEHAAGAKLSEVGSRRRMIATEQLRFVRPGVKRGTGPSWFANPGLLGVGPAESGLLLAGARAEGRFGDVPCLTVNSVGGGWAVMLNLAVGAYLELRALPGGGRGLRELVGAALKRARVRPAVELAYDDGTYPPPSVAAIWDSGAVRLVVLTRDGHDRARPARVRLRFASRSPPAVYDALEGRFVGWTSEVETELAPEDVRLFALLPYRLRSIFAEPLGSPRGSARRGPEAFEVTLRRTGDADPEFHVLRVTVEDPEGMRRRELSRLVEVSGGRAEFVVPFAASDRPGLWTMKLRDAATGVRALRRFVR